MKTFYDHLGNQYSSITEMCKHYNVSAPTYRARIKRGCSVEEALTKSFCRGRKADPCVDHLGNKYKSITEMCRHYNISETVYRGRRKMGYSVEDALLKVTPNKSGKMEKLKENGCVVDHLGNKFKSISDMCRYYGQSITRFYNRIQEGWTLERALTETKNNVGRQIYTDHLGRKYKTFSDLCNAYGQNEGVLRHKLYTLKMPKKKALLTPSKPWKTPCVDHLGNTYESVSEMCRHYNVSVSMVQSRLRLGWTVKKALTVPIQNISKTSLDHLGNEYKSFSKMCKNYNISRSCVQKRMKKGWSLEEALTTPTNYQKKRNNFWTR